jgi:hypothetical protein
VAGDIKTTGIDQKKLRKIISDAINDIRDHDVVKEMFEDHDVKISEIDTIPVCFADIDVSARTDHGCIYLNVSLLDDIDSIKHYLVHEITHWAQQTTGSKPTKGAEDGEYLENEFEIEGFQNQVEYMADVADEETAEEYVEQVIEHHDYEGSKADDKKEELMESVAVRTFEFIKLAEGDFDNLQPDDELTMYHGTSYTNMPILWGVDATHKRNRLFGGPAHAGLFVTPKPDAAKSFAGNGGIIIEFKTLAKNLYGTDWSGNTYNSGDKFKETNPNHIWKKMYPNSFAPYLSESLSRKHEPQALFKGMLSADVISRVNYKDNWYTLDEFYDSKPEWAGPNESTLKPFERLPFDPTKNISLNEFYELIAENHDSTRDRVERMFSIYAGRGPEILQEYIEQFDWTPSVAKDIAEQIISDSNEEALDNSIAARTIEFMKLASGEFDSLQPDDELILYHGTGSENKSILWGVDATQEKKRHFSKNKHSGLFVSPEEETASRFAGPQGIVIEFKAPSKYLYGTDYGGNTFNSNITNKGDSVFNTSNPNDIWRDKYPNSFAPYLSESLSSQPEPQALFKGILSSDMITRVKSNSDGNWYTLDEFYESGNLDRLPFDPTKKITLDDFYMIMEELRGFSRERSEKGFAIYKHDINLLQKSVERFGWTPSVARDIAEQIINSGV